MRKLFLAGTIIALSIVSLPEKVGTSNLVEASLFPVSVSVNDKDLTFSNSPVLNYGGKAYLPVRELVDGINGIVSYTEDKRKIEIHIPSAFNKKSEQSSMNKQGDFVLSIHSSKKTYHFNEPLDIWGTLTYLGEEDIVVGQGNPVLLFYIIDSHDNKTGDFAEASLRKRTMSKGAEYTSVFSWDTATSLNYLKSGMDLEAFLESFEKPWQLEKGMYTVGVSAQLLVGDSMEPMKLRTEFSVEVK
ncbi:hypothetical protein FE783_34790 [Paenibacillus mesophilus]|uniref:hypothetical protein n=1 Tax=Paenibacillus mesophilus TaxID=2582849 RepID=UPI00110D6CC3|nr:hypothetical protein [Paenibacillus mesophilus]TMV43690.1 hypothetical protein FE783_34790 [Paenibacillus mesophilus]